MEGGFALARHFVLNAVSFDARNTQLILDASVMLDCVGDADTALKLLERGRSLATELAAVPYSQGLFWAGKGDLQRAANYL